jgi:cytochrome oxidase assembly protein ShyY1
LELADNHRQYAATWFALAAALVVIFVLFRRRLGAAP